MKLLLQIRTSGADITYFPIYLSGAIRRHIGQRAEELNAKAKAMPTRVAKLVSEMGAPSASVVRQPSDVEVFTEVYRGISKIQRARRKAMSAVVKQEQLL